MLIRPSSTNGKCAKNIIKSACIRATNIGSICFKNLCARDTNIGDVYIGNTFIKDVYIISAYISGTIAINSSEMCLQLF